MHMEAKTKCWAGINFTSLKKMKSPSACVHSFIHVFQGVLWLLENLECLSSIQMNVFFKSSAMGKVRKPRWLGASGNMRQWNTCVCVSVHMPGGGETKLLETILKYTWFFKINFSVFPIWSHALYARPFKYQSVKNRKLQSKLVWKLKFPKSFKVLFCESLIFFCESYVNYYHLTLPSLHSATLDSLIASLSLCLWTVPTVWNFSTPSGYIIYSYILFIF